MHAKKVSGPLTFANSEPLLAKVIAIDIAVIAIAIDVAKDIANRYIR